MLYALGSDALWTDMGTPEKYLEANLAWALRERSLTGPYDGLSGARPDVAISNSFLHPDVRVEEGAHVRDALLLEGGHVLAGAMVRNSVLGPNVIVGLGAVVDDLSVLGDGWEVAAGAVLSGARLPAA